MAEENHEGSEVEMIYPKKNVKIEERGTLLILTVETDIDKVLPRPSKSGKTFTVGTTGGFKWGLFEGTIGVNLTVSRRL